MFYLQMEINWNTVIVIVIALMVFILSYYFYKRLKQLEGSVQVIYQKLASGTVETFPPQHQQQPAVHNPFSASVETSPLLPMMGSLLNMFSGPSPQIPDENEEEDDEDLDQEIRDELKELDESLLVKKEGRVEDLKNDVKRKEMTEQEKNESVSGAE